MLKLNWRVCKWCTRHLLGLENQNFKSFFSHNVTFLCYSRVEASGVGLLEQDIQVTDQNRFRNLWCSCFYLWKKNISHHNLASLPNNQSTFHCRLLIDDLIAIDPIAAANRSFPLTVQTIISAWFIVGCCQKCFAAAAFKWMI